MRLKKEKREGEKSVMEEKRGLEKWRDQEEKSMMKKKTKKKNKVVTRRVGKERMR